VTRVRAFRKEDIGAIVELRTDSFRRSEHDDPVALATYIAEVFFGNPWYDDHLPSLVAEDAAGRIVGFLGVVPRHMTLRGRPLRVITTTQFMVAQAAPPLVASQLLRRVFEGPQDFALADVASVPARRLWESLGGVTATTLSLSWTRLLRPLRHLVSRAAGGRRLGRVAGACAAPIDTVAGHLMTACGRPLVPAGGERQELRDTDVAVCLAATLDNRAMRGHHDPASVAWLLDMMRRRWRYGPLRASRIVDGRGDMLGWYLFHAAQGGSAHVVDLATRPRAAGIVLDHLFGEAWRQGCTAVTGRFDTRLVEALAERHAFVHGPDTWVLVHARDPELLAAVARDDAALTRLDGEWWMAF
jgi:hypothetical protein